LATIAAVETSRRPARVGPYEIIGKLGGGGMATVFLGRRVTGDGDLAAVKVMLADLSREKQYVHMFTDEGNILSRLNHPNISRTLEVGHDDSLGYIAMELLLGRTLADTWEAAKAAGLPFRFDVAAWLCGQVARGMHHAHELTDEHGTPLQIVHRDVNPSNIFLSYDGTIKLFDFGLAKAVGRSAQTRTGIVKGKVPYLSPEQLTQEPIDRRSDIFSLGSTLWELTTLTRLFKRDREIDTLIAIRDGDIPDPRTMVPDYPESLFSIVKRALAVDRADRYQRADELADDLQAYVRSQGVDDMRGFVGALLHRLFPGERQRQAGWLAKMSTSPGVLNAPTIAPPAPIVASEARVPSPAPDERPSRESEVSKPMPLMRRKT
jgi:serine/threonine-protein kinase